MTLTPTMGNPEIKPTSVALRLAQAILLANEWATRTQISAVIRDLGTGASWKQLGKALLAHRFLSVEALTQFESIVHQQELLPGFEISRKLGAGGMGTVYRARHLASDQDCALKVISARLAHDQDFLSRFHRESRALINLRHPHLANVIESGTAGETHYLAMEFISGPSAGSLLKEHGALPLPYVIHLLRQVATCLAYVYTSAGLVHRDVKPENILLQRRAGAAGPLPEDDHAKLIDFGLVKAANDDEHLTQTGMTIGTPLYMSPEQVRGDKLDCRSDIYGLGATAFHLLTGQPPFRGTSPGAIMSAHLTEPVPDPGERVPSLGPVARRLVTTAMAKSSTGRFASFDAFIKACDQTVEELSDREGDGVGNLRLMRKPLVIARKPVRRPGEVPTPPAIGVPVAAPSADLSERILRKHQERQVVEGEGVGDPHHTNHALHPVAGKGNDSNRVSAQVVAALAHAHDEKMLSRSASRPGKEPHLAQTPAATSDRMGGPLPTTTAQRSAVFDEDPNRSAGTGPLPWAILASALIIAAVIFSWRMGWF